MPAIAPPNRPTEQDDVRRWRLAQLMRAGYTPADAFVLSRRDDVDLHVAAALLAAGCPRKTALRILL